MSPISAMMMPSQRLQKIATTIPMMTTRPPSEMPAMRERYPVTARPKRRRGGRFAVRVPGHPITVPGRSFEIRFPDGSFEIDASGQHPPPGVGEKIRRSGRKWRVIARTDGQPVILDVEDAEEPKPSMLRLRFPDGDLEIRWTSNHPPVGTLVRSRGSLWRVHRYSEGAVFLERAPPDDELEARPGVVPTMLDADAALLERIKEA